jgi:hypothetical protein
MDTTYTVNVVETFRAATADDLAQGLEWYGRAREIADGLATGTELTTEQCAGVIAALSPMVSWRSNIVNARRLIARYLADEGEPTAGYGLKRNVAKAWRILQGCAEPLDVLSGPKVRAFYSNIIGDPDAVTVDRWAARLAPNDPADVGTVTAREYREISAAFVDAAARLDVTPRDLQAATWVYFRRVHGRESDNPTTT